LIGVRVASVEGPYCAHRLQMICVSQRVMLRSIYSTKI